MKRGEEHESAGRLRDAMVDYLRASGHFPGRPARVEAAFRQVPRHLFVPTVPLETAYSQDAIVTRRGPDGLPTSSSSMPAIMALMLGQLDVEPGHRVLEIGAGTGYNAALLSLLAGPEGDVTAIDLDEAIVREAREHLDAAGFPGTRTVAGDGWRGVPEYAPYDRIEATVGVSDLSPSWMAQLKDGGRLVAPLWLVRGVQFSVAFERHGERLRSVAITDCGFMRLRGPHAGPEFYLNVHGWTVPFDEPDPARVAALEALLSLEPRIEPAPPLPGGWRTRLLLEEPRAVALGREGQWQHTGHGMLEIATPSLAFVTARTWDHQLYIYGSGAARDALLERLARITPLDTRDLTVTALPVGAATPPDHALVLRRRNFFYIIREKGAPPSHPQRP